MADADISHVFQTILQPHSNRTIPGYLMWVSPQLLHADGAVPSPTKPGAPAAHGAVVTALHGVGPAGPREQLAIALAAGWRPEQPVGMPGQVRGEGRRW